MIAGCTDVVVFIVFQFGWQPIQFKFWNPHQAHSDLQFNVDFSLVSIAWLHRPCLPRTMLITTHACTPPRVMSWYVTYVHSAVECRMANMQMDNQLRQDIHEGLMVHKTLSALEWVLLMFNFRVMLLKLLPSLRFRETTTHITNAIIMSFDDLNVFLFTCKVVRVAISVAIISECQEFLFWFYWVDVCVVIMYILPAN
jgi:hypothetical protein